MNIRPVVNVLGAVVMLRFLMGSPAFCQTNGSIVGKVIDDATGGPLPFVNIVVKGTSYGSATNEDGRFSIGAVPPGTYTIVVSLIGHLKKEITGIEVRAGEITRRTISLKDEAVQLGAVEVYGASFRREKITEAPAAVTTLEPADIKLNAGSGQLPRLVESMPGVDIAQNGMYDFNINTRGFNSSLTRRLLVLLDGRDLSIVFLGSQEWNGLSVPIEDLGRLELVRGPGSALYGANAFNGVLNIITPPPKQIVGTKITLAGGELNTVRGDVRHAGVLGKFSYKLNVGRSQGDTWSVRRDSSLEYQDPLKFLHSEVRPLNTGKVSSTYGSVRADYEIDTNAVATAEGGMTQVENEVFVTGIGRIQVTRALKPWGRASYSDDHSIAQVWASGRSSREPQYSLSTGLPIYESSATIQGEYQYHTPALGNKLFLTTGLSLRYQTVDTRNTAMLGRHRDDMSGVYGQAEYRFSDQFKAVGAARWDRSTLHSDQLSPKAAFVWSPSPDHSFRITYNRAFQSPNYAELFLRIVDPDPSKQLAYLGNSNLTVEKIQGVEFGYKGIFGRSLYLTLDTYYNELKDFITDLTPGVNPAYHGQEIIDGKLRTVWSYGNAGRVSETGAEAGVNYYLSEELSLNANYAWFDFNILEQSANDQLMPNAPRNKLNGGVTYRSALGYEAGITVKYVPSFDWAAGIYQGRILAYTLVDLAARYNITPRIDAGINVSNLFNRVHYEIFGGSLLKRRAIATLTVTL